MDGWVGGLMISTYIILYSLWELVRTTSSLPVPSPGKGGELGVGLATPPRKNCNRHRNVNESKLMNSCSGTGRQPTEVHVCDT